ncbi:hypothetical protein D3C75_1176650 [compost metagenome]
MTVLARRAVALDVVAALAGCYAVVPGVGAATRRWYNMVTSQFAFSEHVAAVSAQMLVALEQSFVRQRRHVVTSRSFSTNRLAFDGNDGGECQTALFIGNS